MTQAVVQLSAKSRDDVPASNGGGILLLDGYARRHPANGAIDDKESRRRRELGEFLKAKRAALRPEDFGLPVLSRRRTPGLRREELAQVSGVGVTWYTWLEQGRDIRVSAELLQRLSRTLRLSPNDAVYLFSLAGQAPTEIRAASQHLIEDLQAVLDGYASGPAFVIDPCANVLAFNKIADLVYHFSDYDGPWRNNHIWRLFMDPYRRQLHRDWPDFARYTVGLARGIYANPKVDPEYQRMLADLCKASPDFNRMWDESRREGTNSFASAPVHFQVSGLGNLTFLSVRLTAPARGDMAIFLSPFDDDTRNAMLRLTSRQVKSKPKQTIP